MQREYQHDLRAERHLENLERREDGVAYDTADTLTVFHPSHPTKILVSSATGPGWISGVPHGVSDAFLAWMLCYEPLIRGLERRDSQEHLEELHHEFHRQGRVRFGVDGLFCAKVRDLAVVEIGRPFEVRETDGKERIVEVAHRSIRRNIML